MSAKYPLQIYRAEDYLSPFAQSIYARCREIAGPGSDPRKITIFSPGPDMFPYVIYLYIDDFGSSIIKTTDDIIEAINTFDFSSYWLTMKQAALLTESYTQEEADYIT